MRAVHQPGRRPAGPARPAPARVVVAVLLACVGLVLLVQPVEGWAGGRWVVVACDVGQGDALVLRAGAGAGVLVDAGPDGAAVDRCLRDLGVDRLPLVVLSHLHADHVDGLVAALHRRGPSTVLVGPVPDGVDLAALDRVLEAGGSHREEAAVGERRQVGDVGLVVLAPRTATRGTEDDQNNSSLVARAEVSGVRVLLTGDIEADAQRELLRSGTDLRADVLKVPHHGSADGDPRLLATVGARAALVSAGAGNSYGHPRPSTLAALAGAGLVLGRTDTDGDVAVVVTGDPAADGTPPVGLVRRDGPGR